MVILNLQNHTVRKSQILSQKFEFSDLICDFLTVWIFRIAFKIYFRGFSSAQSTFSFLCGDNSFSIIMDAIKNKMKSLKSETENALSRANQLDTEAREANQRADKNEEMVRDLQKKMQHLENDLDQTLDKLQSTTTKFDEKDKAFQSVEGEAQVDLQV